MKKQVELFCHEYVVDFNGAAAAKRAGYAPKNARFTASQHLTNANVQRLIYDLKIKRLSKIEVTQEYVVNNLKELSLSDDPAIRLKATDLLGKHTGIYDADNTQKKSAVTFKMEI